MNLDYLGINQGRNIITLKLFWYQFDFFVAT